MSIDLDKNSIRKIIENTVRMSEGNGFQELCDRLLLEIYSDDYTQLELVGQEETIKMMGTVQKRESFSKHTLLRS